MSELLSLIIFDIGHLSVAVSAESVNSFVPLKDYDGKVPEDGFPDFLVSSGILDEGNSYLNDQTESFLMAVTGHNGTTTYYLTPPPCDLVEYDMRELYPLSLLIEKVSSVSNLSGYCLHKGIVIPILEPRLESKDYEEPILNNFLQEDNSNV